MHFLLLTVLSSKLNSTALVFNNINAFLFLLITWILSHADEIILQTSDFLITTTKINISQIKTKKPLDVNSNRYS